MFNIYQKKKKKLILTFFVISPINLFFWKKDLFLISGIFYAFSKEKKILKKNQIFYIFNFFFHCFFVYKKILVVDQ